MPHRIALNRNPWSDATQRGITVETFLHVPIIASIGGGVVAVVGGLLAQISSNDAVANTGLWVSLAGIVASLAGLAGNAVKIIYDDRQKARDHELAKQREAQLATREARRAELIKQTGIKNKKKIKALIEWAHAAKIKYEGLPDPPTIKFDDTNDFPIIITPDPDHPA
jgi:hypothetical protein